MSAEHDVAVVDDALPAEVDAVVVAKHALLDKVRSGVAADMEGVGKVCVGGSKHLELREKVYALESEHLALVDEI